MSSVKHKYPVCINIFPTLDYIELVQLDDFTDEIKLTIALPCTLDATTRQIQDIELFGQTVKEVFTTNKIPFSTPVVLVVPSFFTREIDLPSEFTKDELRFALISEAEKFHVFKNLEPKIDWIKTANNNFLYSAFPRQEIEKISSVFQDIRIPLKAIELNYFSIFRGLLATGTISDEVTNKDHWCLSVLTDTNFFAALFEGVNILKISDTPLSQNVNTDENITEIQEDFRLFANSSTETFNKLVLVNNASKLQSTQVLESLGINIPVANIDQNASTLSSRGAVNASFPCSLETVGGVYYTQINDLPSIDFKIESALEVGEIDDLKTKAFKISLAICGITFLITMMLWGFLAAVIYFKDQDLQTKAQQASKLGSPANMGSYDDIQRKLFVKKAVDQNVDINNMVVKIGTLIKDGIWLESLDVTPTITEDTTTSNPPITVRIEGQALDANKINQLNTDLSQVLNRKDLVVPVTEEKTQGDTTYWHWVIETKAPETAVSGPPPGGPR